MSSIISAVPPRGGPEPEQRAIEAAKFEFLDYFSLQFDLFFSEFETNSFVNVLEARNKLQLTMSIINYNSKVAVISPSA